MPFAYEVQAVCGSGFHHTLYKTEGRTLKNFMVFSFFFVPFPTEQMSVLRLVSQKNCR